MSNVEDYKLRFSLENEQFEQAAQTTLNTLGKLKTGLNFDGAVSGFSGITKAIGSVTFDPLANALDNISNHFNVKTLLMATGIQELERKIINSATNIINSVTFGPVTDGFKEYELKMGSVQTIMASTKEPLEVVNKYLAELNEYADKTIYSFSDMTSSIGKFTNAGVKLEDAVAAIKGISNEAALSGANAQQASHAMYNFAQALSTGYVKLIDWKSIEVANMATLEFKQQLLETALALGTVTKDADGYYHTLTTNANGAVSEAFNATTRFNDNLQYQWLTTQVLVKTLGLYANETEDIGKRAYAAAQDVKTFTQLMDTLKEAVGSGWANTFEILFGDFNQARELFTGISKAIGDLIDKGATARNEFLSAVLGGKSDYKRSALFVFLDEIFDRANQMKEVGDSVGEAIKNSESSSFFGKITDQAEQAEKVLSAFASNDTQQGLKNTVVNLETLHSLTREILSDKYGTGENRITALTEAGYSASTVQKYINILHGLTGGTWELTEANLAAADAEFQNWLKLSDLSDKELLALGITQDEISVLRSAKQEYNNVTKAIDDLGESTEGFTYRELIIKSFKNAFTGLSKIIGTVKEAFRDIFPPITVENVQNAIAAFYRLSKEFIISDTTAANLKETFKGLFSFLDIIRMAIGGIIDVLSPVWDLIGKFVSSVASALSVGGGVLGSLITSVRDGIKYGKSFSEIFSGFTDIIDKWAESDTVKNLAERFASLKTTFMTFFSNVPKWAGNAWTGIKGFFSDVKSLFAKNDDKTLTRPAWIEALIEAGGSFKHGTSIVGFFKSIPGAVSNAISSVRGFFGDIKQAFVDSKGNIVTLVTNVFSIISERFNALRTKATDFVSSLFGQESKIRQVFNSVLDFIKGTFQNGIQQLKEGPFSSVISWIEDRIENIKTGFSAVKDAVSKVVEYFKTAFSSSGFGLTAFASETGTDTVEEGTTALGWFANALSHVGPALSFVLDKIVGLYNWIVKVGRGLWDTLRPALNAAGSWLDSIASSIQETFANAFANLMRVFDHVKNTIAGLFNSIRSFIGSLFSSSDSGSDSKTGITDAVESAVGTGLSNEISTVKSETSLLSTIIDQLGKIDLTKLIKPAILILTGRAIFSLGTTLKKAGKFFGTLSDPIGELADGIKDLFENITGKPSLLDTIQGVAIDLLLLASSLFVISKIPADRLDDALLALAGCVIGILAFTGIIKKLELNKIDGMAAVLIGIGVSMLAFAGAAKIFSTMDFGKLAQGLLSIVGLLFVVSKFLKSLPTKEETSSFGVSTGLGLIGLATSLIILAGAVALFGHMDFLKTLVPGLAGVALTLTAVGLSLKLFNNTIDAQKGKSVGKNMLSVGAGMVLLSAAIAILAADVSLFGHMKFDTLKQGLGVVLGLLAGLGLIMKLFNNKSSWDALKGKTSSKNMLAVGAGLVLVATAMTLMAVPLAILSLCDIKGLAAGAIALGALVAVVGALSIAVARFSSEGSTAVVKFAAAMLILAPAIDLIALALGILSLGDIGKLAGATAVIGVFIGLMAGIAYLMSEFSYGGVGDMKDFAVSMIELGAALAIVAGALTLLTVFADGKKIGVVALSLGLLAAGLAAIAYIANQFIHEGTGTLAILELAIALAVLVPVLQEMDKMAWPDLLENLGRLAVVMLALGAGAFVLQGFTGPTTKVAISFGALAIAAAALIGVLLLIGPALADAMENFLDSKDVIIRDLPQVMRVIGHDLALALVDGMLEVILDFSQKLLDWMGLLPGFGEITESAKANIENIRLWLRSMFLNYDEDKAAAHSGGEEIAEAQIKGYARKITEGKGVAGRKTKEVIEESVNEATVAAASGGERIGEAIYDSVTGEVTRIDLSSAVNTDNLQQALSGITDTVGGDFATNLFNSITSGAGGFGDSLAQIFGDIDAATPGAEGGNDYMGAFLASIAGGEGDANNAMNSIMTSLMGSAGSFDFTSTGDGVMDDIVNGLMNGSTDLNSTAGVLMKRMLDSMDVDSSIPGGNMIKEYAKGMLNSSGQATSAAKQVANASTNNLDASQAAANKGYYNGSSFANGITMTEVLAQIAGSNLSNDAMVALLNTYGFNVNGNTDAVSFINGLLYNEGGASSAGDRLGTAAKNGASNAYWGMYSAGTSVSEGFLSGIASKISAIQYQAQVMADNLPATVKALLRVNSPSKVMQEIGHSVPEGLALGIKDGSKWVRDAAVNMGNQAITAVGNAQDKIAQLFDEDYKVDPTIRPVLDLTDIQNGSQEIDNILGNKTVSLDGAMDNVDATISQLSNAGTGETSVVNAINGLRTDLDSLAKFVIARAAMEDETVQYSSVNVNMDGKAIGSILTSSVIERINTDQLAKLRAVGA